MKKLTDLAVQLSRLYRRGDAIGVDFQAIADHLAVHVAVKGPDSRYRYINLPGQVQRLLPGALSGQVSDADLLGSQLGQALLQDDRRAMASAEPLVMWSAPQRAPDGTLERTPQVKMGLHDERGNPLGLIDVTPMAGPPSPQAAAEVMRMNQALDLITEVLGLLMRCDDELSLLEKVCATLVLRGGYLAAAVVPINGDQRQAGVPLSLAGDRSELALPGPFRLDDPVWENHPVARAAEAGICVVHKAHGQDDPAPWRQACPTQGTQALIALPLKADDDVRAVLLLACDGLDTFTPTRAVLLQRMADELSLGMELLRSRQRLARERQQREFHLRQQLLMSQRLRLATESADVGIWEWDLGRGLISMDDRVMSQLNLPPYTRTLPMATVQDWVHPEDRPALIDASEMVIHEGKGTEITLRATPPDGCERTLRLHMSPLSGEGRGGQTVVILGTSQNVSADTSRARQVKSLDAKLRLAVQATGLGLWELDLQEQTVVLDAHSSHLHGLAPEQGSISLARWLGWIHPGQRGDLAARLQACQDSPGVGQIECALTPPDGRLRRLLINWASQADDSGRVVQLVGTQVDVTERRRDESRAAQMQQRLALMAGATGVGRWRYDLDDGFQFDEAMFRLLGSAQAPHPATAWLMEMCLPREQREALELALLTADEQMEVSLQWQGLDGMTRHVVWMGTVERDNRQTVVRGEGLCIDVTIQQQMELARQAMKAPAPDTQQPSLAVRISSELRSPLNAMLGFVQLLRHGDAQGLPAQQDQYLQQVEQAGWQLLDLLNDAIDLSRLQTGITRPDLQPVSLIELMGELHPLLEAAAQGRQVQLIVPPLNTWPGVIADPRLLRQALLYLGSHALQQTQAGGLVTIGFDVRGPRVMILVQRTGSNAESQRLQQVFRTAEAAPVPLGPSVRLSIAREALLAMGGDIDTHHDPELSESFTLTLAATPAAACPSSWSSTGVPAATGVALDERLQGRLLYVEDNPSNVLLVRECLSLRPGITLQTATTVQEGLQALSGAHFDLILIDLQLPDGEGYEVLRAVRAGQAGPVPCIALTASAMLNERDRALSAGFDEFWTKPLLLAEFLGGLDRWLAPASQRAPSVS